MMRQAMVSILLVVTIVFSQAQRTVSIFLDSLPVPGVADSSLYIAGSFNGWNPRDKIYLAQKDQTGHYFFTLKLADGGYEYKITRGAWSKVECTRGGTDIQNRFVGLTSDTVLHLTVAGWLDEFARKPRRSTASRNVHIIDSTFSIPQLKRTRRVWIYLPPGYSSSPRHYPVLYMHDGQNVFDDSTSFAGEWAVDETLDSLCAYRKGLIVVAIDNGGSRRINEYCPYDMEKFGKGEGDEYVDFLVKVLKPFIDKKYRTLTNRQNTFIAGSSMGGLISMYAVLKYPKVFGGAGIFSPALWVGPKIFDEIKRRGSQVRSKIYFYCGGMEGEAMEPDMLTAFEGLRLISRSPMITSIRPDGRHSEAAWREEFPLFYLWLMEK